MTESESKVHYFGIRHHGPGSTQRLLKELSALQPAKILIEGPSDCTEEIQWLINSAMEPPIALLAYRSDQSEHHIYYPFVDYSPEYQACLYALKNSIDVAFIDIPVAVQLAAIASESSNDETHDDTEANPSFEQPDSESTDTQNLTADDSSHSKSRLQEISHDPFARLAQLSGYEDGESWWNDFIEQNTDDSKQVFDLIESIMQTLRSNSPTLQSDLQREAYMRLEINKACKETQGTIAVVCGAWHVPALKEKHTLKADKETLKALAPKLPKSKLRAAWIPWTSPRLANASGYGAGVRAPQWYKHLWQHRDNKDCLVLWLGKITQALREQGHIISTASVIEAVNLYQALASIRLKPSVGFEEIRDAVIACLCFGESIQWQQIEHALLFGSDVGSIPSDAPLIPLLEDLKKQQKALKLKPEALSKTINLDLRSQAGLNKSILLHRLTVLNVPWGELTDSGASRGTFRERWILAWEPEYAVQLIENLAYGSTIEHAANNKLIESINQQPQLSHLAQAVQLALEAHLHNAARIGLKLIDKFATQTNDTLELLKSLPPLISISRYGTAREISLRQMSELVERLTIQTALSLPYSARNLSEEEATHYSEMINTAHQSILIADFASPVMEDWWKALHDIMNLSHADAQIRGLCSRLLYFSEQVEPDQLYQLMQKMLSSSVEVAQSAQFFVGFFDGVIDRLIYDSQLREVVEKWLISLGEDTFIEYLPLFRRVFSHLDSMERKRLFDAVLVGQKRNTLEHKVNTALLPLWASQFDTLTKLIRRENTWNQN